MSDFQFLLFLNPQAYKLTEEILLHINFKLQVNNGKHWIYAYFDRQESRQTETSTHTYLDHLFTNIHLKVGNLI